jgi:hypothetical protein
MEQHTELVSSHEETLICFINNVLVNVCVWIVCFLPWTFKSKQYEIALAQK